MSRDRAPAARSAEDAALAAPPDDLNPAIRDARATFIVILITVGLFIGAVVVFIL